jgi:GT2 family glycosyltransferase
LGLDPVLITVSARAESADELDLHFQTLASLRSSAATAPVLVVDDRSPAEQAQVLELACQELGCTYVMNDESKGRSSGLNVGLTVALEQGMDACFVAPGLVLPSPGWLERLQARTRTGEEPPAVAGGAVVEPDGLIRQAGYFFSAFRRNWSARLRRVPQELLGVSDPLRCPVSSELQLVRHDWIGRIGAYDEELSGANASLDYCLRAYAAGADCVLEPTVWARALDSRDGEPETGTAESFRLRSLHTGVNFSRWTPEVV